ncbi:MAG: hypothetical protein IJH53_04095 [Oscillospiraceae bacterium]|nr:hypothetical protein [Oscillospiraceae bacterium]
MKKLISVILAIIIFAGLMPFAAFAEDAPAQDTPAESSQNIVSEVPAAENKEEAPAQGQDNVAEIKDVEIKEDAPAAEENKSGPVAPVMPEAPKAPSAPETPDLEGLSDEEANKKIAAYNEEVDLYNSQVEAFNQEMEAYLSSVDEYNEQVEAYNEAAAGINAEAEEHNNAEDAKEAEYNASMDTYNKRLDVYNSNLAKIEKLDAQHKDKIDGQMDTLGDIGRVDSESIYGLGTVLEEDYYVTYGRRSVKLGNAGDLVISWDDLDPTADHKTITVDESTDKSGTSHKVANLHIYQDFESAAAMNDYLAENGYDCMNITVDDANNCIIIPAALIEHLAMMEFEIVSADANDTITVSGHNSVFGNGTSYLTPRFFEGYTAGNYWYTSMTTFMTNAADYDSDWLGNTTFSFENGTCDYASVKNTLNINEYLFNRYSNPEPVKPEEFTANRMELLPVFSVIEANAQSLSALNGMALREIKKPAADPAPAVRPTPPAPVKPAPAEPTESEPEAEPVIEEIIADVPAPMAAPIVETVHVAQIDSQPVPLAETPVVLEKDSGNGSFALLNIILNIVAALLAVIKLLRRRNEGVSEIKSLGMLPFAAMLILNILTCDPRLPMVIVNQWTPLFVIGFAASVLLMFRRKEERV